jgi:hypothetical protein
MMAKLRNKLDMAFIGIELLKGKIYKRYKALGFSSLTLVIKF